MKSLYKLIWACENFFRKKIVIFQKFSIFDSKFLENSITDFQTENSFELSKARTFEWYIIFVPTMKFNFPALWFVEIFWHFFAQNFLNTDMKLLYILIFWKNPITIKLANLDHPILVINFKRKIKSKIEKLFKKV